MEQEMKQEQVQAEKSGKQKRARLQSSIICT